MTNDKQRLGGSFTLPGTSTTVHRMGYGAMQLAGPGVWGAPRDPDAAIAVLREAVYHAALAWALIAPFCIYLLHRLLTPVVERMAAQIRRQPID